MTVFKTYLRVLRRNIAPALMYTVILIAFGAFNMQTNEGSMAFTAERPDVCLVDHDGGALARSLTDYMKENCNLVDLPEGGDARSDALFYRDVNYIMEIPAGFTADFMAGEEPEVTVQTTGDYQGSYAQMLLSRYLKVAQAYRAYTDQPGDLADRVASSLRNGAQVELTAKTDHAPLGRASFYFNFASYSILAVCVYVICLILSSFKEKKIRCRTVVSSMREGALNTRLLFSNGLFALVLWGVYALIGCVMVGDAMLSAHGALYLANSFVFTFCALTMALLIGNLVTNKNAVNGIVNVVALGSSFLCGAFVPVQWLPAPVLTVAHVLPAYWYIQTNEALKTIDTVTLDVLKPLVVNMAVVLGFSLVFILATNIVSRRKRRMG